MPDNNFTNNIEHVRDGEQVNSSVTSRATQQLQAAVRYLKDRIDAADSGEALVKYDATLSPDTLVGSPVYYRQNTQRYEPALADIEYDAETGTLVAKESCNWVGVVVNKVSATLGDILLAGTKQLSLSSVVIGAVLPGRYFLSNTTPGRLVRNRPPIAVSVLVVAGDDTIFIDRQRYDFLEDHVHYRLPLEWRPAGDVAQYFAADVGVAEVEIANPDSDMPGWLPADHPIFNSTAPVGAAYGYNLSQDPAVSRVWPPVPPESAEIIRIGLDRLVQIYDGVGAEAGLARAELLLPGPANASSPVLINRDGIWWMSALAGSTPWPLWYHSLSLQSEMDIDQEPQLILYFSKMATLTDRTVVTSLTTPTGSPVSIKNCDGQPASTGSLKIDVDIEQLLDSNVDDTAGHIVFKELNDDNKLVRGPVCEGLVAGTNVSLSSTHPDGSVHQGVVTVSVASSLSSIEIFPSLVRLSDVEEDFYQEVPHVFFPAGRASYVTMVFNVPVSGLPTSPRLRLRMLLLGRANGTMPNLPVKYRKIVRPSNPTALPLPASDAALTFTSTQVVTTDQYVEKTSAEIVVAAGDTVLIRVARNAVDGYSGHVGMLRASAIVAQAS